MKDNILAQVAEILTELFDTEVEDITPATTAEQVEGWDSMTHLEVIGAIEAHFKIKFATAQLMRFQTVGDMCEGIRTAIAE